MTKEEREAFYMEVYGKALAMGVSKAEAHRRAWAAVEVREWRENHDRIIKELEDKDEPES
jgi:uncharacterized protein YoaH (UPF0181 family)